MPYSRQRDFAGAGYAPLLVRDGETEVEKGVTRQVGGFSFTRVYQAGHEVPAYQPQAAYEVFRRAMGGWDVATGRVRADEGYKTEGRGDGWGKSEAPEVPRPRCYVLKPESCEREVWERVVDGTAVVRDWFVVDGGDEGEGGGGFMGDEL